MSFSEIVLSAQQLSLRDKVRLARILLDDVDAAGAAEDIFPLETDKTYYIATPYNMYGVAEILIKTLEADNAAGSEEI